MRDSNIDRLLAAFERRKLDRVPNFEIWIGRRTISHVLGRDYPDDLWTMPPADAVELVGRIGQDAIVCSIETPLPPQGSLLNEADLAPVAKRPLDIATMRSKLTASLDATAGTGTGVVLRLGGPLTQTYMSCGPIPIQSFMMLLYDCPELVEACMALYTGWTLRIIEALKDLPFHLFYIGDDLCDNSGPMISPATIEKLWAPYYQRIIEAAHSTGRPIICHCCGKQEAVIPYWVRWKVEACHPLQAGANDIYEFKKRYGAQLCPIGNISVGLLSSGTADEVRADTRRHIEALSGDGGYVLCSDHSIIDSVIPENFMAMIETAHRFGRWSSPGATKPGRA